MDAAELLPHQAILENFVHHNPLHALEGRMKFGDAIAYAHSLERYLSPGARAFSLLKMDPRKRVNEALVDLASVFLDRGAAKWPAPERHKGFLHLFASLETLGYAPWRQFARESAEPLLEKLGRGREPKALAEKIIWTTLDHFGIPPQDRTDALRSMLMELKGWAGMFQRMEVHPEEAPPGVKVNLTEFCAVQCLLTRSSLEAVARQSWDWDDETPLSTWLNKAPALMKDAGHGWAGAHASAVASLENSWDRRETLEQQFQSALMHAVGSKPPPTPGEHLSVEPPPQLQLYTCIDDREGSLRRHVEAHHRAGLETVETFGVAGFFGIPIQYRPIDGRDQMILAPEGQKPSAVLVEDFQKKDISAARIFARRRKALAAAEFAVEKASFSPLGSLAISFLAAPLSMLRLGMMGFSPLTLQTFKDAVLKRILPKVSVDVDIPFTPEHAASLLARTFKDIGTHRRFARLVLVLGHGAASTNNPFAAAYNCGACGGRDGGPNARLLARLANDAAVRHYLRASHEIFIPEGTHFVGGRHNTTTDQVEWFDSDLVPPSHAEVFDTAKLVVAESLGENALERTSRFLLAQNVKSPEAALRHVHTRSVDPAEVRPELNHATNAAVVVGRRELTRGHFLDRRVFLPSYDPWGDDDAGTNLEHVLAPALVVCSGINLEYLLSTVDEAHGAGTKAPLNIVGNIGVLQGTAGDLKPGLPSQMTEMHVPVRLAYVVDSPVARVQAVLSRRADLRDLVANEWVRFLVRDPSTGQFFQQSQGNYLPVEEDRSQTLDYVPLMPQIRHGLEVAKRERIVYWSSTAAMVMACVLPVTMWGPTSLNPHGTLIAIAGTLLSLPVLAFSRRYLHGEFMFTRFAVLCVGLLSGFNMVATAPSLMHALGAWSLFGFASTFLIGSYCERPTVRNNATFAFAAYHVSDFALLVATAFSAPHVANHVEDSGAFVAGGLLLAAIFKSSQFPLTSLFVRSMEGPTPASALGYAGLSAHVGVVLLTSTLPLWFEYDWARITLGTIGLVTAGSSTLVAKIRADRKGAVANATSGAIGLIFFILALGHSNLALWLSLGHAAFRMIQILRSPNTLADSARLRSALGSLAWPVTVPNWLYHFAWWLRRLKSDFHLLNVLAWLSRGLQMKEPKKLSNIQQSLVTAAGVVLAGFPYTPLAESFEHLLIEMLPESPFMAGCLMAAHFGFSVIVVRFLFLNVLRRVK